MRDAENLQKIIENQQKIKSSEIIQTTNARKEKEKQKRNRKLLYKKSKWLLYDVIMQEAETIENLNTLLYDFKLQDIIIDKTFSKLNELYKNLSEETQEDINFYLLENYSTLAKKIINIKTKERKEKAAAEYKKQLLLQYEEMQKENARKEQEKQKEQISIDILAFIIATPFIILLFKLLF